MPQEVKAIRQSHWSVNGIWHSLKSGPETRDLGPGTLRPETREPEIWDPKTTRLWELRQNL